ncbi:dienelactone hydrolase family protein [Nocardioides mangrovicus]|uniref:dienelactone hydrolase family protein n=1 Tax=Nocardioides mangrovicus TaxID=2478913 RepID=UPI0018E088BD|nr:dienelactone hydrolase family protein [Nocardioides mangrovicus]
MNRPAGYLATPAGEGPWPGVVVIHEIFGLDEEIRIHTDRLAAMGYLAFAVDLFAERRRLCTARALKAVATGSGPEYADIATAREWLRAQDGCTGRVGVVGFCLGGGFALMTLPDWDAAAVNYGALPRRLGSAVGGSCPVVGSYGGRDRTLPGAARKLAAALREADVAHDVKEYPAAGHSFLNEHPNAPAWAAPIAGALMHVGPEPTSAADAWVRIDAFLGEHLRA